MGLFTTPSKTILKKQPPHILLVNPWIHDFAAYDVWAKPMGLLILASILRDHDISISYIDCLDRFHPKSSKSDPFARNGRGPYDKTPLPMPEGLEDISRRFSRYGIKPDWFTEDLHKLKKPDLIMVTSIMTYWSSGVAETISLIKSIFPDVPVILGGIYATLCKEHAEQESGADKVITGSAEEIILDTVEEFTGFKTELKYDLSNIDHLPYPAYDLQNVINYIPIQTAKGCPFSCRYCASNIISPEWKRRAPELIINEIKYWHDRHGVKDYAFYDDALLVDSKNHAEIIFNGVINSGMKINFHTPNALHVREISEAMAELMYKAGFKTLRLGVETTDFQQRDHLDSKITQTDFEKAVYALKKAGFPADQTGAYLLTGLPGQTLSEVENSVRGVLKSGITPVLTHYTPIPHTSLWDEAVKVSRYDLVKNPLFTNNSILPCSQKSFSWKELSYLKQIIAGEK